MQQSHPILTFKPPLLFLPTLYPLPLHPHHRLMLLAVSLHLLLPLSSLNPSGFFNGMLRVSVSVPLNCYTSFHLIPLTSFVSRNLTLIYLPLSRSLGSLLCNSMAPTSNLVFFLLMSQMLAAVSSFLSGRAYPPLSFLPSLFLRLILTLIM